MHRYMMYITVCTVQCMHYQCAVRMLCVVHTKMFIHFIYTIFALHFWCLRFTFASVVPRMDFQDLLLGRASMGIVGVSWPSESLRAPNSNSGVSDQQSVGSSLSRDTCVLKQDT